MSKKAKPAIAGGFLGDGHSAGFKSPLMRNGAKHRTSPEDKPSTKEPAGTEARVLSGFEEDEVFMMKEHGMKSKDELFVEAANLMRCALGNLHCSPHAAENPSLKAALDRISSEMLVVEEHMGPALSRMHPISWNDAAPSPSGG